MEFRWRLCSALVLIVVGLQGGCCFFDPITIGVGAGAALGFYKLDTIKDLTYCRLTECCNERSIPADIEGLRVKLKTKLFGQHIVQQKLIPALRAHFYGNELSRKPLVISFHGTPGTGKNFVADQIAEALYEKGLKSRFVHKYVGRADFPVAESVAVYKERIRREVFEGIKDCPRSLFIFDEVDKMPEGVFESLTSLVDYNAQLAKMDSNQAIFIFISNTAGVQISDQLGELIKTGTLRGETKLSEFERIVEMAAYNMEGGLRKTSLIEAHVIDHYLPFLPLEKQHIIECLKAEFKRWGRTPSEETVENIITEVVNYDRSYGIFATAGCKKLEKKVALQVAMTERGILR